MYRVCFIDFVENFKNIEYSSFIWFLRLRRVYFEEICECNFCLMKWIIN